MNIHDLLDHDHDHDNDASSSLDNSPPLTGASSIRPQPATPFSPFGLAGFNSLFLNSPSLQSTLSTPPPPPPPGFHLVLVPCAATNCACGAHGAKSNDIVNAASAASRSGSLSTLAEMALGPTLESQRLTFGKIVQETLDKERNTELNGLARKRRSIEHEHDAGVTQSHHQQSAIPTSPSTSTAAIAAETARSSGSNIPPSHLISADKKYACPFYGQRKSKKSRPSPSSGTNIPTPPSPTATTTTDDLDESICFARFRRRQEMERHVLSVHGSEQDKGWVCPGTPGKPCGKRYARADALRKHLDSAKSKAYADGCSFGLGEAEIIAMVKRGAVDRRGSMVTL
ncbi:hypothetical protein BDR26DRAFT_860672 [Obelidium mucronatum]|nr:hypothetical protein BDR26DRAFT_860672 [Obelidium mucronatum]